MKDNDKTGSAFGFLMLVGITAFMAYKGIFYTTGRIYYEACFEKRQQSVVKESHSSDPYKETLWARCETIALEGMKQSGMKPQQDAINSSAGKEKYQDCPNFWSEVPMGGLYFIIIDRTVEIGGPSYLEYFTPAEDMVVRIMRNTWPKCIKQSTPTLHYNRSKEKIE